MPRFVVHLLRFFQYTENNSLSSIVTEQIILNKLIKLIYIEIPVVPGAFATKKNILRIDLRKSLRLFFNY